MATPGIQTPCIQTMDLRRRFDAQRSAFERGAPSYRDRIDALRKIEHALLRRKDEIVKVISDDFGGRAAEETLALDLFPPLHEIRHAIKHLKDCITPRRAPIDWQFWPPPGRLQYHPPPPPPILPPWTYPLFLRPLP